MLDEPEETGGTINWPMAIAISVVVHVVILGLFWMLAGPKTQPVPLENGKEPAAAPVAAATPEPVVEPPPVTPPTPSAPAATPSTSSAVEATHPASPGTAAPAVETTTYTVKKGDFLSRIANKYGCTAAELAELNGFPKDKMLHPGNIIKVPVKH